MAAGRLGQVTVKRGQDTRPLVCTKLRLNLRGPLGNGFLRKKH